MRWKILVWIVVAVIVVAVGAVAVVVASINPNDYRAEIAAEVESQIGHKVSLDGPLNLKASLSPTIVAHDVRIANASWGSRPEMATIKSLEVQVALLPLIDGNVVIRRVVMNGADILLETDAKGKGNWAFGSAVPSAGSSSGASGGSQSISIDDLVIENSKLAFVNGATGRHHELAVDKVALQAPAGGTAHFRATVTLDGLPLTVTGQAGSLDALAAGRETAVKLSVSAADFEASGQGTLGNLASDKAIDAKLRVDVTSLGLLKAVGVTDLPVTGPASLEGRVQGGPQKLEISDLTLSAAGSTMTGKLGIDLTGKRPALSGDLAVDRLDLDALTQGTSPASSSSSSSSDRVFPKTPLPFADLRQIDGDVKLTVAELVTQGMSIHGVSLHAVLSGGKLTIDPLKAQIADSAVDGKASVDASAGDKAAVALLLASPSLDVGAVLGDLDLTRALTGKANVKIDVNGKGDSVAAIMADLNGEAVATMADGRLDESSLDLLVGGATAVVGGLFSTNADKANLSCLAIAYDIKDGIANQKVLLLDTQYSTVTGKGSIDLRKETIDLTLVPRAKHVTLNMAVPVKIGGTLANPTYTPAEGALALRVGSVLGATIFPPALLLSLGGVGLSPNHPCLTANKEGSSGGSTGSGSNSAGSGNNSNGGGQGGSSIGNTIEGIGKSVDQGLKSLFGN